MPTTPSLTQRICRWIPRLCGWTVVFRRPSVPKCVVIFYPHTSNWDFVWGVLAYLSLGWPVRWCAKDNWFRWPVDILARTGRAGQVAAIAGLAHWPLIRAGACRDAFRHLLTGSECLCWKN